MSVTDELSRAQRILLSRRTQKKRRPPSNNADGQTVDEETKRPFFAADVKISQIRCERCKDAMPHSFLC